jgi:hypothetical protein
MIQDQDELTEVVDIDMVDEGVAVIGPMIRTRLHHTHYPGY